MADPLPEPDRAEGAPHPRDTARLIGQEAAEAAFLTAFSSSFDEFGTAFLLAGTRQTLPTYLYSQLRSAYKLPMVVAAAAVIIVASLLLVAATEVLRRGGETRAGRP